MGCWWTRTSGDRSRWSSCSGGTRGRCWRSLGYVSLFALAPRPGYVPDPSLCVSRPTATTNPNPRLLRIATSSSFSPAPSLFSPPLPQPSSLAPSDSTTFFPRQTHLYLIFSLRSFASSHPIPRRESASPSSSPSPFLFARGRTSLRMMRISERTSGLGSSSVWETDVGCASKRSRSCQD